MPSGKNTLAKQRSSLALSHNLPTCNLNKYKTTNVVCHISPLTYYT